MTLYELADILRRDLVGRRYENQNGRIMVKFECCEVKDKIDSSILATPSGNGKTWDEAAADYARNISGKLLVFDACSKERMEFQCPTLEVKHG